MMMRAVGSVMTAAGDFHPDLVATYCSHGDGSRFALNALHGILFDPDFVKASSVLLPKAIENGIFPVVWAVTKDVSRDWVWCADSIDPVFVEEEAAWGRWHDINYQTYNLVVVRTFFLEHLSKAWQDVLTPCVASIEAAMYTYLGVTFADLKGKHPQIGRRSGYDGKRAWNSEWVKDEGPCASYPGLRMRASVSTVREVLAARLECQTSITARLRLGLLAEEQSILPDPLKSLWVIEATAAISEHHVDAHDPEYRPDPYPENFDAMGQACKAAYMLSRYGAVPYFPLDPPIGAREPEVVFHMSKGDARRHDELTEAIHDAFATESPDIGGLAEIKAAYILELSVMIPAYTDKYKMCQTGRDRGSKNAERERAQGTHHGAPFDLEWAGNQLLVAWIFCDCFEVFTRDHWREMRTKLVSLAHAPLLYCSRSDAYGVWSDEALDSVPTPGCPHKYPWRTYIMPDPLSTVCEEHLPDPAGRVEDIDTTGTTENPTRAGLYPAAYLYTKAFPVTSRFRDFTRIAVEMSVRQESMIFILAEIFLCFILGRLPTSQWSPPFEVAYGIYRNESIIGDLCGSPDCTADVDKWRHFFLQSLPRQDDRGWIPNGRGHYAPPNKLVAEDMGRLARDRRKVLATEKKSGKRKPQPAMLSKVLRIILYSLVMRANDGTPMKMCYYESGHGMEMEAIVDTSVNVMAQMVYRNWCLGTIKPDPYDFDIEDGWIMVVHVLPVQPYDGLFSLATHTLGTILPMMYPTEVRFWPRMQEAVERTQRKTDEEYLGALVAHAVRTSKTDEEYRSKVTKIKVPLMCGPNYVSFEMAEYMRRFVMLFFAHQEPSWLWIRAFPVRDNKGVLRVVRMEIVSALIRLQEVVELYQDSTIPANFMAHLADVARPWEWEVIAAWVRAVNYHKSMTLFPLDPVHARQQRVAYARSDLNFRHEGATVDPDREMQDVVQVCPSCGGCVLSELVTIYDDSQHSTVVGPVGVQSMLSPVTMCLTPTCRGILPGQWKPRANKKRVPFGPPVDVGVAYSDRILQHIASKAEKERREAIERARCQHVFGGVSGGVVSTTLAGRVLMTPKTIVMACVVCTRLFVYDKAKHDGEMAICHQCKRSPLVGRAVMAQCFTCDNAFNINDAKSAPTYWSWHQIWDEGIEEWRFVHLCRLCTKVTKPRYRSRHKLLSRPYEAQTGRLLHGLIKGGQARLPDTDAPPVCPPVTGYRPKLVVSAQTTAVHKKAARATTYR